MYFHSAAEKKLLLPSSKHLSRAFKCKGGGSCSPPHRGNLFLLDCLSLVTDQIMVCDSESIWSTSGRDLCTWEKTGCLTDEIWGFIWDKCFSFCLLYWSQSFWNSQWINSWALKFMNYIYTLKRSSIWFFLMESTIKQFSGRFSKLHLGAALKSIQTNLTLNISFLNMT